MSALPVNREDSSHFQPIEADLPANNKCNFNDEYILTAQDISNIILRWVIVSYYDTIANLSLLLEVLQVRQ